MILTRLRDPLLCNLCRLIPGDEGTPAVALGTFFPFSFTSLARRPPLFTALGDAGVGGSFEVYRIDESSGSEAVARISSSPSSSIEKASSSSSSACCFVGERLEERVPRWAEA